MKYTQALLFSLVGFFSSSPFTTAFIPPDPPLSIPGPPADPPKVPGDGIGSYNSKDASIGDRLDFYEYRAMAKAADTLGLNNAARNLDHYLDNTGDDLYEVPEAMMADLPDFKSLVLNLVQTEAKKAYKAAATGSGSTQLFSTPWKAYDYSYKFNKDWFYALGAFSYSVAGIVKAHRDSSKSKSYTAEMSYVVYVFDRYNWDGGKSVEIGPFTFKDEDLGRM
ncbi:hypothetical protein MPH_06469, partial [Macrophomina phaseolina MS6]